MATAQGLPNGHASNPSYTASRQLMTGERDLNALFRYLKVDDTVTCQ
jgi:hypothetical protein